MSDRESTIEKLVKKAKEEGWPDERLYDEIWDAAVEWGKGLVDYSAING